MPDGLRPALLKNALAIARVRRSEEERLRSSADALRQTAELHGHFLAEMSHELRTPLNAIIGYSDALLSGTLGVIEKEQHRDYVARILESGRFLDKIIATTLDMAQIEAQSIALHAAWINPQIVVEKAIRTLADKAAKFATKVEIATGVNSSLLIFADEMRVQQVLINLIGNAIKFAPGGFVAVDFAMLPGPSQGTEHIKFVIRDNGMGIAPEDHHLVFEKFGQANRDYAKQAGGVGLGLSIAKSLVGLMGGDIDFTSTPGEGTEFWFDIPAFSASP